MDIEIDITASSNEEWKMIILERSRNASAFEIYCWNEESKEIEMWL